MQEKTELVIDLDGLILTATLFDQAAPESCKALREQLPIKRDIIHSMWSGPLALMNGVNLADAPLENPVTFLKLGDLVYHPAHKEIGIAYNTTQFREPVGSVYITLLGRVHGDLDRLVEIGRNLQRTGAKPVVIRRP